MFSWNGADVRKINGVQGMHFAFTKRDFTKANPSDVSCLAQIVQILQTENIWPTSQLGWVQEKTSSYKTNYMMLSV